MRFGVPALVRVSWLVWGLAIVVPLRASPGVAFAGMHDRPAASAWAHDAAAPADDTGDDSASGPSCDGVPAAAIGIAAPPKALLETASPNPLPKFSFIVAVADRPPNFL